MNALMQRLTDVTTWVGVAGLVGISYAGYHNPAVLLSPEVLAGIGTSLAAIWGRDPKKAEPAK